MATFQYAKLMSVAAIATGAAAAVYQNPSSTVTFIPAIVVANVSGAIRTVQIYNVTNNSGALGTAATTNLVVKLALAVDETVVWELPHPIILDATNDSIQALADGSSVNIQCLGAKYA